MTDLPEGWQLTLLGEIGFVQSGMGFPNEYQGSISGAYPVYKVGDVSRGVTQNNGKLQVATNYVSTEVAEILKGHIFDTGSTLFAKIGEALKLNRRGFVVNPGLADNNVMGFKSVTGINDRFIYYFLRTQNFAEYSRSTTVPSIRKGDIENVQIALPPSAEQTRIAAKLDELLAQVDTLKARIDGIPALLKRFRQSVLAAAVSGRLTEEWRIRCFPGSISRTKGGWQEISIENLCKDEKYSLAIGPFGSNLKVTDYRLEGKPLVFVREIRAEKFGDEKTKFITPEKFSELKPHQVFAGDILITKMGDPPGDVAVYPDNALDAVLTADCIKVSINESLATRKFTYFQMKSDLFRTRVKAISAGVAQQKVSLGNFRKLKLWVPPLDEQTEIVRRVEQLFAFADQLEARVAAAQERIDKLTQSILAKAFRGELVPQDPNDEPASVLLERIKAQRAAAPKAKRGRKAKA